MSKHYHSDNDVGVTDDEASKLLPNTSRATKLLVVGITVAMVAVVLIGALVAVLYSFGIVDTSSPKLTYVQSVTSARMYQHLQQFQSIAAQYNNSRAVNLGYNASVEYVYQQLKQYTNYNVYYQNFTFLEAIPTIPPTFTILSPSLDPSGISLIPNLDYNMFRDSGSGNVTGSVYYVNFGCSASDYEGFPENGIALAERSPSGSNCTNYLKGVAAMNASASALIVIDYPGVSGEVFTGRFGTTNFTSFLAFSVSNRVGRLLNTSVPRPEVNLVTNTTVITTYTMNLIADTPTGNTSAIIVVGSHLDSVPAGPGINDNGSGSSANLELAIQLFQNQVQLKNQVRFAWWGAEELGLLGSTAYVESLTPEERANIALNINFDMLGSPNYYRGVLDGNGASPNIHAGSVAILNLFIEFFEQQDLAYILTPFNGRSDYGPFLDAGIPAGGLKTGAEEIKTPEWRDLFGGNTNAWMDPCYHQSCDTIDNVNLVVLQDMAQAAAYTLQQLGNNPNLQQLMNVTSTPSSNMTMDDGSRRRFVDPEAGAHMTGFAV